MPVRCPQNAPPGSRWTVVGGGFKCIAPDGTIVPDSTGSAPPVPRVGGVPGGGVGGGTRPAAGYTTLPGGTGPGGFGGGGFGSGGAGGKNIPWWASGGITLIGSILKNKGKQKERQASQEEAKRLEQEAISRAKGKAALMRGILNANGYGNIMTDDQIFQYVLQSQQRPNTAGGTLQDIGGDLLSTGRTALLGTQPTNRLGSPTVSKVNSAPIVTESTPPPAVRGDSDNAADPVASADFWEWLNKKIHENDQAPA